MRSLLVAAGVLLAAACTSSPDPPPSVVPLEAELTRPGTLTVCVSLLGPPAASLDASGAPAGYNVDFAREVAARMGLEADLRETAFRELLDAVDEHACDASISSQNIVSERLERIDFVPYTRAGQRVLVAAGNPRDVFGLEELCGLRVSAGEGTTHVDLVAGTGDFAGQGLSELCAQLGRAPIELETFPAEDDAVAALMAGSVDAHLGNPNYVFEHPQSLELSLATLPAARQGIGVAKDRPSIRQAVEEALGAMIADGTYHQVLLDHLRDEQSARDGSIAEQALETP